METENFMVLEEARIYDELGVLLPELKALDDYYQEETVNPRRHMIFINSIQALTELRRELL